MSEYSPFYEALQSYPSLDLRDNRGKRHSLSLVLMGVVSAIIRGFDGTLSGIHRDMQHHQRDLCSALGIDYQDVISRSQLPLVLEKVDVRVFSRLLYQYFKLDLSDQLHQWFAVDGKELRGSIEKGKKRGEAIVQLVNHDEQVSVGCCFYNGSKESEIPAVQHLLQEHRMLKQAISLDALHCIPQTLSSIAQADGLFLVGLKANKGELYQEMTHFAQRTLANKEFEQVEKGHGRLEKRHYRAIDIHNEYFDQRWDDANFQTLIEVQRDRTILKTGKSSTEKGFYLSNAPVKKGEELFNAIRKHWSIETNHHYRDVTLKEDQYRSKKNAQQSLMAVLRAVAINVLNHLNPSNFKAKIQHFQDNFDNLTHDLAKIGFL